MISMPNMLLVALSVIAYKMHGCMTFIAKKKTNNRHEDNNKCCDKKYKLYKCFIHTCDKLYNLQIDG